MKDITTEEAIKMLDKFITEHKLYNIKQSDGLEQNIEKVLSELEMYKHYYEELTTGQVTSSQLLQKYVDREAFDTAVEHQTELIRENSHLRYELFNNQKELEKKDKIIDAMAKFIDTELSSEHLTRVLKKEVLPLKTYREDIKQYFERRVKK